MLFIFLFSVSVTFFGPKANISYSSCLFVLFLENVSVITFIHSFMYSSFI